ncbi:hypothetical protein BO71DRAFT_396627 [Aspergillus ellipticus CBS 707.79]|uniref:Uncharacterized protein n=1 Tax=Aspergillus ellipticus CBS 707.79 TaxID=1448320 RepID=A0A319DJ67_9EURO|nr:hypothetical protein BO71DRAFT_396627 [Aspergillus ellipticus CBS 707.79]
MLATRPADGDRAAPLRFIPSSCWGRAGCPLRSPPTCPPSDPRWRGLLRPAMIALHWAVPD